MCESNARRTESRAAHGMPDERGRAADCGSLSGEIQDNEQVALAAETILMFIHKNMEEDYPTLFGEHDMRR